MLSNGDIIPSHVIVSKSDAHTLYIDTIIKKITHYIHVCI